MKWIGIGLSFFCQCDVASALGLNYFGVGLNFAEFSQMGKVFPVRDLFTARIVLATEMEAGQNVSLEF